MDNFTLTGALILVGGLLLSACSSDIEATRNLAVSGEDFSSQLAENYRELALFEADQMYDWPDAWLFADKALAAARDEAPAPEHIDDWQIPAHQFGALGAARADLVSALDSGFAEQSPIQAALAQSSFDCWIEQLEEEWQLSHIKECRSAFETSLRSWHARQITSQEIPEKSLAPVLEVRRFKAVDSLEENCVATSQPASVLPVKSFRVQFSHDSAVLDGHANDILDASASAAQLAEIEIIYVEGHADRSGAPQHNLALSMQRALAVWDQLIVRGIPPHKIWLGPRGEGMPETITRDGEKNADNRRVTILLEPPLLGEVISAKPCANSPRIKGVTS